MVVGVPKAAKPYQVKQVRAVIVKYKLAGGEDVGS